MDISHIDVLARFGAIQDEVPWPVCLPSSWVKTVFEQTNGIPLLGRPLRDEAAWSAGDEGRGAAKRAITVCSWQSVMQETGGHTYLSRYLTAVIPARYASETTFHQI